MDYEYIDTSEKLDSALDRLRGLPLVGVDTEAAGFHRYFDRISLIQVSSRTENFLIDPIELPDLSSLASVLENPETETIFHDADFDLRILDRDLGLSVAGLFDTQIAAAFLGEKSLGLGAVLLNHLGIDLPKAYQRADWAQRPLTEGMKDYAVTDTAHLPALRDELRALLEKRGRLHWAEEEFRRREETRWSEPGGDTPAFMRMKGARDLTPRGLAVLREVFDWRDSVGMERDQATFRVLSNDALLEMSLRPPADRRELAAIKGVSDRIVDRYGKDLLEAVQRGLQVPEAELPEYPQARRSPRDPEVEDRTERLRMMRNQLADQLGLDPGFLVSRAELAEVARKNPSTLDELIQVPDIRAWQVEAIGEPLIATLRE